MNLLELFRSRGHDLKKSGKSFVCRCPFHDDDTPSLSISPDKGLWHCFGCGEGGDGIEFLQKADGLEFGEAADKWRACGGQVKHRRSNGSSGEPMNEKQSSQNGRVQQQAAQRELEAEDLKFLSRLQDLYARDLAKNKKALSYLEKRGITDPETIRAFGLGYVTGKGLPKLSKDQTRRLQDLGILNARGNETLYGCIVCPVYDENGNVVSFYGRLCDGRLSGPTHRALAGGKFGPGGSQVIGCVNYPALRSGERVVLVEGFLDALACYQGGIRNVLAAGTCGASDELLTLFSKEGISEVWIAFDPDEAGDKGAQRVGGALERRGVASFRVRLDYDPADFFLKGGTAQVFREVAARGEVLGRGSDESEFLLDSNGLLYRTRLVGSADQMAKGKLKAQILCSCTTGTSSGRTVQDGSSEDNPVRCTQYRDVLNLYVGKTRKAFCNRCAEHFGSSGLQVTPAQVEADLALIIEGLEQRERQAQESRTSGSHDVVMSPEEQTEARSYLEAPNLVRRLQADMEALGYVGEDEAKLLVYLIGTSRKLRKPLSAIVSSGSGAGKSFLAGLVEQLMPPEDVIFLSRLSPQALFYMPPDFAVRKVLLLEERAGSEAADYAIRSLQSKEKLTQLITMKDPTTGQMSTKMFEVFGPMSYIETTTESYLNPENTSRCFEIPLDESAEQTRRIHEHQRRARALGGLKGTLTQRSVRSTHHNVQRLLRPVPVVIPYAEAIEFPHRYLRTRRDHERFLSLIEASAFLHQFQRVLQTASLEGQEVEYIEATVEDYALAYRLALKVLWVSLDELSRWGRELLNSCRGQVEEFLSSQSDVRAEDVSWTRRQLRESSAWPDKRLIKCLQELVSLEYLRVVSGGNGKTLVYGLNTDFANNPRALGLLTPEQLAEKIGRRGS